MNNEELLQLKFEQSINILIMYKQENPEKEVFLNEKDLKKAIEWYKGKFFKN